MAESRFKKVAKTLDQKVPGIGLAACPNLHTQLSLPFVLRVHTDNVNKKQNISWDPRSDTSSPFKVAKSGLRTKVFTLHSDRITPSSSGACKNIIPFVHTSSSLYRGIIASMVLVIRAMQPTKAIKEVVHMIYAHNERYYGNRL